MKAKLYVIPGSHPCACVEAALRLKGIEYERVDLLPIAAKLQQRQRFGGLTVPGVELDGERILGSTRILRRLDALAPEPRLYPEDSAERAAVEEAEAWGDEVLQAAARRIAWAFMSRDPASMLSYAADAKLPIPRAVAKRSTGLVAWLSSRINRRAGSDDAAVQQDLRDLPGWLDRVDAWIADGLLGGEPPNAADLQIASSVRLLQTLGDVAPLIEGRPCAELAQRLFPNYPGNFPAGTLPAGWVPAPAAAPAATSA